MSSSSLTCPECSATLRLSTPLTPGKSVQCPRCGTSIKAPPPGKTGIRSAQAKPGRGTFEVVEEEEVEVEPLSTEDEGTPRKRSKRLPRQPRTTRQRTMTLPLVLGGGGFVGILLLVLGILFMRARQTSTEQEIAQGPTHPVISPFSTGATGVFRPGGATGGTGRTGATGATGGTGRSPDRTPDAPRTSNPEQPVPVVLPPVGERPLLVLDAGGHSDTVKKVFFTPDGKKVISVSHDKTIRVWDVYMGESEKTYRLPIGPGEEGTLDAAALSPNGKLLAVGGVPFGLGKLGILIHVINLETGRVERVLKGHRDIITSLAFSPDGTLLLSGSTDHTALAYRVATSEVVAEFKGHTASVTAVAWNRDGSHLSTTSRDGTARIWILGKQPRSIVLKGHKGGVISNAWSPDGESLATGGVDGTVRIWSTFGNLLKTHSVKNGADNIQLTSLTFTRDGRELLFTGVAQRGHAGILEVATGHRRLDFNRHSNTVMHGSLSPDSLYAVTTGGNNHETFIWKIANEAVLHKLEAPGKSVWGVAWTPDGKSIAWGNENRGDTIRGLTRIEHTFRLSDMEFDDGPQKGFLRNALSAEGYTLEAVDFFRINVKKNGQVLYSFRTPLEKERIYSVSLLPGGRALIGGSWGLYLFDLEAKKFVRRFLGHSGTVLGISPSPDCKHFLTGGTDQTIRIWSPEREEPVLSLFFAGRDWIAWTPEGFYSASPAGERLMGWQINNGPTELARYCPAIQFHASLFQPEVIRLLLSAGSLEAAIAQASRQLKRPINAVHIGQVLPPAVTLLTPTPGTVVNQPRFEVKAKASSPQHPVTALRLLVDGRPYLGEKGLKKIDNPRAGEVEASWTVALTPGNHLVSVQAESVVSKGMSSPVEVVCAGSKPELPALYVLAVGVSAYPGKLRLAYAASDATLLSQTLQARTQGVFSKVEIRVLTDEKATRAGILEGLKWLGSVMTPLDVCILSFSGHGARDEAGNFYLVPVDVSPQDVEHTCVSGELLKQTLANLPGRVIAMLDACHSGTVAEQIRASRPDNLVRDLVSDEYGVIVMCSSLGREYSLESSKTKAGFFTLGLVEGLNGQADFNHDRIIHIHELDFYAGLRVRQLSGGVQNPVTGRPPGIRSFPMARF